MSSGGGKKRMSGDRKRVIAEKIAAALAGKDDVCFAYIFGSFASKDGFKDIDVGIFISDENIASHLSLELELERELEDAVRMPVDVRIINNAPLSFVYNVLRQKFVIVDKDKTWRADFEGLVYKKYFDFKYLRDEYLREIINAPF